MKPVTTARVLIEVLITLVAAVTTAVVVGWALLP